MDGGREASDKVVNEANPIFNRRRRVALLAGEAQRVLLLAQAEFLQQVDVLRGDLGSLPLRGSQILRRHSCFGSAVPRESWPRWHQQMAIEEVGHGVSAGAFVVAMGIVAEEI